MEINCSFLLFKWGNVLVRNVNVLGYGWVMIIMFFCFFVSVFVCLNCCVKNEGVCWWFKKMWWLILGILSVWVIFLFWV